MPVKTYRCTACEKEQDISQPEEFKHRTNCAAPINTSLIRVFKPPQIIIK